MSSLPWKATKSLILRMYRVVASHSALWPLKGNRMDFGTVKFPEPKALNDSRIAVGKGMTAKGQRAMLWDLSNLKNIQEIDLNDQINPKLGRGSW